MRKEKKKTNWISIITLIIAVFGGVPGLFVITNHFYTNRVIFGFNTDGYVGGEFTQGDLKGHFILLFGTITNKGGKPLHLDHLELEVKIKDKWISMFKSQIPKDDVFEWAKDKTHNFEIKDAAKNDLQGWKRPITADEPACGNLMFLREDLDIKSMEEGNKITFKLTCFDVYGERYTYADTYRFTTYFKTPVKLIKHNVIFGIKDK